MTDKTIDRQIGCATARTETTGTQTAHDLYALWLIEPLVRSVWTHTHTAVLPGSRPDTVTVVEVHTHLENTLTGTVQSTGQRTIERELIVTDHMPVRYADTGAVAVHTDPLVTVLTVPSITAWTLPDRRLRVDHTVIVDQDHPEIGRTTGAALVQLDHEGLIRHILAGSEPAVLVPEVFGEAAVRKDVLREVGQAVPASLQIARSLWRDEDPVDWLAEFLKQLRVSGTDQMLRRCGTTVTVLSRVLRTAGERTRRGLLLKNLGTGRPNAQGQALLETATLLQFDGTDIDQDVKTWRELAWNLSVAARQRRLAVLTADQPTEGAALDPASQLEVMTQREMTDEEQLWWNANVSADWERARQDTPLDQLAAPRRNQPEPEGPAVPGRKQKQPSPLNDTLHRLIVARLHKQLDGLIENDLRYEVARTPQTLNDWHQILGHCINTYADRLKDPTTLLVGVYAVDSNTLSSTMEIKIDPNCTVRIVQDQGAIEDRRRAPHRKQNRKVVEQIVGKNLMR